MPACLPFPVNPVTNSCLFRCGHVGGACWLALKGFNASMHARTAYVYHDEYNLLTMASLQLHRGTDPPCYIVYVYQCTYFLHPWEHFFVHMQYSLSRSKLNRHHLCSIVNAVYTPFGFALMLALYYKLLHDHNLQKSPALYILPSTQFKLYTEMQNTDYNIVKQIAHEHTQGRI